MEAVEIFMGVLVVDVCSEYEVVDFCVVVVDFCVEVVIVDVCVDILTWNGVVKRLTQIVVMLSLLF